MLTVGSCLKDRGRELRSCGDVGATSCTDTSGARPRRILALPAEPSRNGLVSQRYSACDGEGTRPREAETSWGARVSWSQAGTTLRTCSSLPGHLWLSPLPRAPDPYAPPTQQTPVSRCGCPSHLYQPRRTCAPSLREASTCLPRMEGPQRHPRPQHAAAPFLAKRVRAPKIHVPLEGSHKGQRSTLVTQTRCPSSALARHGTRVHYTF